jgi:hypothetical protein
MDCNDGLRDAVKRIALSLMLWLACVAGVEAARIDIIVPPGNAAHADLARAARHALLQRDASLRITITDNTESADADLAIAIGDLLLPWSASRANRYPATIAFYVGSLRFHATVDSSRRVTALFRDQPIERQLRLATLILPRGARFAMLYGSDGLPPEYQKLASGKYHITAIDVAKRSDLPRTIAELMLDHDALIAIDDPVIYNRDTIRSVLLTTYRRGRVVIGPSRPFVNAGSLASTYTSSDQYLNQLTEMVLQYLRRGQLPTPQYPSAFRVAINRQVAESLDMNIPDENMLTETLQRSYRELGQECPDGC